jgi:hypothetical protein
MEVVRYVLARHAIIMIGISNPFRLPPAKSFDFDSKEEESLKIARLNENNPWPYWARLLMIREGLKSEGIALDRVLFIPNPNNTNIPADEIRLPKSLVEVYICPKSEHNKAMIREYRKDGWSVTEVPRSGTFGFGSRLIRERMLNMQEWESLIPNGTAEILKLLTSQGLCSFQFGLNNKAKRR